MYSLTTKEQATYQYTNVDSSIVLHTTMGFIQLSWLPVHKTKTKTCQQALHTERSNTSGGPTYTALPLRNRPTPPPGESGGPLSFSRPGRSGNVQKRLRVLPPLPRHKCPEIDHREISRICTIPDSHFPFRDAVRSHVTDNHTYNTA